MLRNLLRFDFGPDSKRPIQEGSDVILSGKNAETRWRPARSSQGDAERVASLTKFARAADCTGIAKPWPKTLSDGLLSPFDQTLSIAMRIEYD
jgi:hypothetical protein